MKKHIIGMACLSCKERFYKDSLIYESELKTDKLSHDKIHMVEEFPKYCSRCGGHLRIIKKYVIPKRYVDIEKVTI